MARSQTHLARLLGPTFVAALLAGCADRQPLAPAADQAPANGAGPQAMIRLSFPGEFPGIPAYARIEPVPPHVYVADGWAVIAFYRDPACVRTDFNLLQFFDPPAAFGCGLTVEGSAVFEPEALTPRLANLRGTGAVPVWFVPAGAIAGAIQDGVLTIGELAALGGLLVGSATQFTETLRPLAAPGSGGGHQTPLLVQSAHGTLDDGRRFQYHLTVVGGQVKSVGLRFR